MQGPGGFFLYAQMGKVHTVNGKMFAVPDPQEVWAVASAAVEIDFIIGTRPRFRSNIKCDVVKLLNQV